MADYIYIDNLTKKGTMGISTLVFENIVSDAIKSLPDIEESSKRLKRNQKFALNRPVRINIRNGVVHIWIAVDIKKDIEEKKILDKLDKEIHAAMDMATEQVPYDIEFKVEKRY
jgi:hypothetical protein